MPIEICEGKIDFADTRHQLSDVKLVLARTEGVEVTDEATKMTLAEEHGLLVDNRELQSLSLPERLIVRPIIGVLFSFRGDGSQAASLLGKRLELPTEDRD